MAAQKRRSVPAVVCIILLAWIAGMATGSLQVKGDDILKNVAALYDSIQDYTVTLDIETHLERLNVPPMHVTMYFKKPDKVHFEAQGFAMIPKEGMATNVGTLLAHYTVLSTATDTLGGATKYKLALQPKKDRGRFRTMHVYVDPLRWTPDRVVTSAPDGRVMTASFRHTEVDGHWMPEVLTVVFSSTPPDSTEVDSFDHMAPARRMQPYRDGTVTIRYSDYRINSGLSDELFTGGKSDL